MCSSDLAQCPAGHIIEMYVLKTKTCKWDRKLSSFTLNYDRGVDILQDTIDMGVYFGLIDNSTQGSFKLIDLETGEILKDAEGKELKIRGKKNLRPYFEEHLDQWRIMYDKVEKMLKQKDNPLIKSFEEMLQIDVNANIGVSLREEGDL